MKKFYRQLLPLGLLLMAVNNGYAQLNPLTLGTIHPGDSLVIYYDVTINNSCGCSQISNQGTIAGSNFPTLTTNDPDTGPADDATITLLNLFPLPVSLYEVKAVQKGSGIEVTWNVSSETNMSKYEVERSTNGNMFVKIGEVLSQNSSQPIVYSIVDGSPNNGINFYRLRLVDRSALLKYSAIVRVDLTGKSAGINIYPNPVRQQIIVQLNNLESGTYQLMLYNKIGQVIYTKAIVHDGGSASRSLLLPSNLLPGIYSVRINNEKQLFSSQLMIVQ